MLFILGWSTTFIVEWPFSHQIESKPTKICEVYITRHFLSWTRGEDIANFPTYKSMKSCVILLGSIDIYKHMINFPQSSLTIPNNNNNNWRYYGNYRGGLVHISTHSFSTLPLSFSDLPNYKPTVFSSPFSHTSVQATSYNLLPIHPFCAYLR